MKDKIKRELLRPLHSFTVPELKDLGGSILAEWKIQKTFPDLLTNLTEALRFADYLHDDVQKQCLMYAMTLHATMYQKESMAISLPRLVVFAALEMDRILTDSE